MLIKPIKLLSTQETEDKPSNLYRNPHFFTAHFFKKLMNPIIPSPIQSAQLLASVPQLVAPGPVNLADLPNPVAMAAHQTNAAAYVHACKRRRVASIEDINESNIFQDAVVAAGVISAIPAVVNKVADQTRMAQQNTIMTSLEVGILALKYDLAVGVATSYNASASLLSPLLRPPPHLILPAGQTVEQAIAANIVDGAPAYPDPALRDPALPVNLVTMLSFTHQQLYSAENYYGLGHGGGVRLRRNALARCYGVRL